ncbi:hypothetical protein GC177_00860 [bacterium]|nr:hypothetical protein [bacterium]
MKPYLHKALAVLATATLLVCCGNPAFAQGLIIGIAPSAVQGKEALQYLTRRIQPGEEALLFDAWNLRALGTFAVPNNASYRSEKAKLNVNRALVGKLLSLDGTGSGAVRLPQFLDFLGRNHAPLADTDIVILGSPLYLDPAQPEQSMNGGKVPNDGYFNAAPDVTPFSLRGKGNLLAGARVYLGFAGHEPVPGSKHAYWVKRFWTLFVEGHGAVLSGFTGDRETLWKRVSDHAGKLPHDFIREDTDKMEMMHIRIPVPGDVSIFERELSANPVTPERLHHAQNVEIGISWDCPFCDLDLHARPGEKADVLNYQHTQSAEGVYRKDFLNSPRASGGFETVAFNVPVDLHKTLLAVNWYGGASGAGVKGEIRIALDGETFALPFAFTPGRGNGGTGFNETMGQAKPANGNWLVLDPLHIVGAGQ